MSDKLQFVVEIHCFLPSPFGRRAVEEGVACGSILEPSPQPSPKGRGSQDKLSSLSIGSVSEDTIESKRQTEVCRTWESI
jgi:hypothetical protein